MGVLTDLVVAPLTEADSVVQVGSKERSWPWRDAKGLGVAELATLHCLLDGLDPSAPAQPPAWRVNPFTKQKTAVTIVARYLDAFETPCDPADSEVVLMRTPADLVGRISALDEADVRDLAQKWNEHDARETVLGRRARTLDAAIAYLRDLVALSRIAHQRGHELFVWISP